MSCAAPNCTNRFNKGSKIRGFCFPSDPARKKQWVINCRRKFDDIPSGTSYKLCEFHFESITRNNKEKKYEFLLSVIELFHCLRFTKGWKPLNIGVIMVTLSMIDITDYLFRVLNKNQYQFLLGHRFSQDAVENIFSQVRKKAGAMPNVGQCLAAIKLISLTQYVSDVKKNNYFTDSDDFLLDFLATQSKTTSEQKIVLGREVAKIDHVDDKDVNLDQHDDNMVFMIAGRCIKAVKKKLCDICINFCGRETDGPPQYVASKLYFNRLNKGGLQAPSVSIFHLLRYCEKVFLKNKHSIFHSSWTGTKNWILAQGILEHEIPRCCNLEDRLITHFFKIRVFAMCEFDDKRRAANKRKTYGTASAKRKKIL